MRGLRAGAFEVRGAVHRLRARLSLFSSRRAAKGRASKAAAQQLVEGARARVGGDGATACKGVGNCGRTAGIVWTVSQLAVPEAQHRDLLEACPE